MRTSGKEALLGALLALLFISAIMGAKACVHGDIRCAVAECRLETR